ncbi:MAG: LacI family transcriptional regulator [Bacteroidales bacterium]|jgi:LacI family transcriptional regulator|nr:LacI family transcriptional regulator [Bacteroidales bacterium]
MKHGTLKDISQATGYSKSTISRVLNGKSAEYRISATAVDKIRRAVKEVNYKPNMAAQILRTNKSHSIVLLVPGIDNPFFASIASFIMKEARQYDYNVLVMDTAENAHIENTALNSLIARNIEGIIIVPVGADPARLEQISRTIPLILIDRYFKGYDLPYVSTDNYMGAYNATKLLLKHGHRKILCIQGPGISVTTQERVRGYIEAMKENGNSDNILTKGNEFSVQNGYIETNMVISADYRPTAIFSLSNTILLGTIKALREHEIKIPDEISLISFDDSTYLDYLNPPITRIAQPIENICIIAFKSLMNKIIDNQEMHSSTLLQPQIIVRDSIKIL